jgi:hypothetical protein
MRKLIPILVIGISALSFPAFAADALKVGPSLERKPASAPRDKNDVKINAPEGGASTGSSVTPEGTSGKDMDAIERDEDKAKRNMDKFKQRPGFKEDVPQPRASATK